MKRKWGIGDGCVNVNLVFWRARSCCLESWWHQAENAPSYCNSFAFSRLSTMEKVRPQIILCSPTIYQNKEFVHDIKDLLKAFSHFHCWKSELHQCSLSKIDCKISLTTGKRISIIICINYINNRHRICTILYNTYRLCFLYGGWTWIYVNLLKIYNTVIFFLATSTL